MASDKRNKDKIKKKIDSLLEKKPSNFLTIPEEEEKIRGKEIRQDLIYLVKKRINSGFYKSDTVIEEMVDYFAKVFEQPQ